MSTINVCQRKKVEKQVFNWVPVFNFTALAFALAGACWMGVLING